MTGLINILVVCEIVGINLTTVHLCAKARCSIKKIVFVYAVMTGIILILGIIALQTLKIYGNGNGLFVILGMLYLVPIRRFYDKNLADSLILLCFSWIYTLCIFSISVQLGSGFPQISLSYFVLAVQTVLFAVTAPIFFYTVTRQFVYTIENIQKRNKIYLICTSLVWFLAMLLLNMSFVFSNFYWLRVLSLICMSVNIMVSFHLLAMIVRDANRIDRLHTLVGRDALTGLKNRVSLIEDIKINKERGRMFYLLYMDLDCFKSVNDQYGHSAGDAYLCSFATRTRAAIGDEGEVYRVAGDEFVGIYFGTEPDRVSRSIRESNMEVQAGVPGFKGVSIGYIEGNAAKDAEKLLSLADRNMYYVKTKSKR